MTAAGILGDRTYALLDTDTGRVVSAKSAKLFPDVLNCTAAFVEAPQSGAKLPPVSVSLPNGTVVRSDAPDAGQALSGYFERNVTLIQSAPDDFVIDAYLPNIAGATPAGMGDTTVPGKLGAALFARLGIESPIPAGLFFDVFPITLLTSSTLDQLSHRQLESRFDVRRFRMNTRR